MSNHIAIAAVTTTVMTMMQTQIANDAVVSGGKVTALPPDKARTVGTGNQINLFLYRISIDAAWRNMDPPVIRPGETGLPPLPLVLSYLVTAYGDNDDEILAQRLLGIAMSVLNDQPVLARSMIASITSKEAAGSGLESQVELIRFIPDPRPMDEISRMWTTFGTGYRLSVSYDAAVVLIDSTTPPSAPLPVLARGPGDTGPLALASAAPQIDAVLPPGNQAAARPGDTVTLVGRNLAAATGIQVTGIRVTAPTQLASTLNSATGEVTFVIPPAATLPAGTVAIAATSAAGATGNTVPLALAPTITSAKALTATLDASGGAQLAVSCSPEVQPGQTVALIVGSTIFTAASPTAATGTLDFALTGLAKGTTYPLRLRIDSVDSVPVATTPPTYVNPSAPEPMSFDPAQTLVTS